MVQKVIRSSRWKIALYCAGCLVVVAVALARRAEGNPLSAAVWLGVIFASICALMFATLLVRPQQLVLDEAGFTWSGGLSRSAHRIAWADIDRFFVWRGSGGAPMVAFRYRPGVSKRSMFARLSERTGADGALPGTWEIPADQVAKELNSWRERALANSSASAALGSTNPSP